MSVIFLLLSIGVYRMKNQVISFMQTKGGAGKTTSLATIATHMAQDGAKIAIIDTDPNKDTYDFCKMTDYNFKYAFIDDANKIKPAIKKFKSDGFDAIFFDTAGADSTLNTYVIANSDLIFIPTKCNKSDASKAVATYRRIVAAGDNFNREIPAYVLLVDVDHDTNITKGISDGLKRADIPMLNTKVGHATGFKELTSKGVIPKSGAVLRHINSLMCELQMKKLIEFYRHIGDLKLVGGNGSE